MLALLAGMMICIKNTQQRPRVTRGKRANKRSKAAQINIIRMNHVWNILIYRMETDIKNHIYLFSMNIRRKKKIEYQLTPLKSIFICEISTHKTSLSLWICFYYSVVRCMFRCFYFRVNYYDIISTFIAYYYSYYFSLPLWINSSFKSYRHSVKRLFVDFFFCSLFLFQMASLIVFLSAFGFKRWWKAEKIKEFSAS